MTETAIHPFLFSPNELRRILGVYASGVMGKIWRDYGIESSQTQTVFCVVEHGQGVIASISKNTSRQRGGVPYWRVFDGNRQTCQTPDFTKALEAFKLCSQR